MQKLVIAGILFCSLSQPALAEPVSNETELNPLRAAQLTWGSPMAVAIASYGGSMLFSGGNWDHAFTAISLVGPLSLGSGYFYAGEAARGLNVAAAGYAAEGIGALSLSGALQVLYPSAAEGVFSRTTGMWIGSMVGLTASTIWAGFDAQRTALKHPDAMNGSKVNP